jgi:hypothetical protein
VNADRDAKAEIERQPGGGSPGFERQQPGKDQESDEGIQGGSSWKWDDCRAIVRQTNHNIHDDIWLKRKPNSSFTRSCTFTK